MHCPWNNGKEKTVVMSDNWAGYASDAMKQWGGTHYKVNHLKNFVDPKTQTHTRGGGDITEDENSYYGVFITEYYGYYGDLLRILRNFSQTKISSIFQLCHFIQCKSDQHEPQQLPGHAQSTRHK